MIIMTEKVRRCLPVNMLAMNKGQNLKLEFVGNGRKAVSFSSADRNAVCQVYELAQALNSINQIKKELEEANLKIRFVKKKIEVESKGK